MTNMHLEHEQWSTKLQPLYLEQSLQQQSQLHVSGEHSADITRGHAGMHTTSTSPAWHGLHLLLMHLQIMSWGPTRGQAGSQTDYIDCWWVAGIIALRRFDPRHALPAHLAPASSLQELLHDSGSLSAISRAVEELPCSLLPDGRSLFCH